ncbi:MAG TPA: hypothetical protein VFT70_05140 [Nocardioides sp.]|nr:hypothetical protein [Nocardioides sp.]
MTSTTRRSLMRAGILGLAAAPLLVAPEVFAAITTRRGLYARSRFAAMRKRSFRLEGRHGTWRVRLLAVGNLPHCAPGDPYSFSLTFRVAGQGPPQGTYLLKRPGFAPTSLFLVPEDVKRRTHRAVVFRKP